MRKLQLLVLLVFFTIELPAQIEAQIIGGKEQLDQVLETQLYLPKTLLTSNFNEQITLFFDLDSTGRAIHITCKEGLNNALREESKRILQFVRFRKTQEEQVESPSCFFSFNLSTSRYNKFFKQRSKTPVKKNLNADSSFIIYTKADRAPEFYKNNDEGLKDFILSEMEYPRLAIEKSVEGTVVVEFIVETNGYVTGTVLKQGVGAGCSEEALRIIKLSKWQPAVLNGKYVRYKTSYPITFSLRNVTRDASSTIGQ